MKEELFKYLTEQGYSMRMGGSYFFDREEFWGVDWMNGHRTLKQRVQFLNYDNYNWIHISVYYVGDPEEEYETFYRGTCKDMEQFKMLYEDMLKLGERW